MNPKSLFEQCLTILGDRSLDYGSSQSSFQRIANIWNLYLEHKLSDHLVAADVAMLMVLFKLMREKHSHKLDNIIDSINYLVLYENNCKKEDGKHNGQTTS